MDKLDRVKNFEDLKGIFSIFYADTDHSPKTSFHIHDAYEISLNLSQNIALDVNEESYLMPKDSLLLFNTMDLHRIRITGNGRYKRYVLWFKDEFIDKLGQFKGDLLRCFYIRGFSKANVIPLEGAQLQVLAGLFQRLLQENEKKDAYGKEILLPLLLGELLVYVNSLYHNQHLNGNAFVMADYQAVYLAIQYIQEHLADELNQNKLSKLVYLDKRQLCNSFQKITGFTTGQYILNCRITAAKALLVQGESVMTVCEKSGFGNCSNFSRTFRKHVGLSPKQYALKLGGGSMRHGEGR